MQIAAVPAFSVPSGSMYMGVSALSPSSYSIYWQGSSQSSGYSSFKWQWLNYQGAERTANTAGAQGYDTLPQNVRPLVVDTQGYQWLGATNYFSTTQTTTPSTGTGQDGDFFFSTA